MPSPKEISSRRYRNGIVASAGMGPIDPVERHANRAVSPEALAEIGRQAWISDVLRLLVWRIKSTRVILDVDFSSPFTYQVLKATGQDIDYKGVNLDFETALACGVIEPEATWLEDSLNSDSISTQYGIFDVWMFLSCRPWPGFQMLFNMLRRKNVFMPPLLLVATAWSDKEDTTVLSEQLELFNFLEPFGFTPIDGIVAQRRRGFPGFPEFGFASLMQHK